MARAGVEPARLTAQAPKTCMSASSITEPIFLNIQAKQKIPRLLPWPSQMFLQEFVSALAMDLMPTLEIFNGGVFWNILHGIKAPYFAEFP